MDALAAEAFLNAEHRVYGLRLQPLSLGHAFTLEALGNSFYFGKLGTEEELRLAAWICSKKPLSVPNASGWRYALWKWGTDNLDFNQQLDLWRCYVSDYVAPPQLWNKSPKGKQDRQEPSRIPNNIASAVRLMGLGMSEQQAWATPVGAAAWYEAAIFESEGGHLDIVTDSERVAIERSKTKKKGSAK